MKLYHLLDTNHENDFLIEIYSYPNVELLLKTNSTELYGNYFLDNVIPKELLFSEVFSWKIYVNEFGVKTLLIKIFKGLKL